MESKPRPDPFLQDDYPHIMPKTAYEVSAMLLLTMDGCTVPIGNVREYYDKPADIILRLGTKVSEGYPSSLGFRVFLRTDTPKIQSSGLFEDNYHLVSCKFDAQFGAVSYKVALKEDRQEIVNALPAQRSFATDLRAGPDQSLYRIDFNSSDTHSFLITHHGPPLSTSNAGVRRVEKLLPFVSYASKICLFFMADNLLIQHLDNAIKQSGRGRLPPSWKLALPDSAVSHWPSNMQTQMVAGSIDIYNALLHSLHEKPLRDGAGTSVRERPEATQFRDFVRGKYADVKQEARNKVYPIMLNVAGGICVELPFGASMLNRRNTYAAINALHEILAAGIALNSVAIVTLYPAQVQVYQDALSRCHKYAPDRGYDTVEVGLIESWTTRSTSIVIADLVRTSNATGNLGYLSQTNRLKMLLTSHRNGLIIVGNRECTATSSGSTVSSKLEKVLQWFIDNRRIVQIADNGLPRASENPQETNPKHTEAVFFIPKTQTSHHAPSSTSSGVFSARKSSVSTASTSTTARKYVGIPGLEHLKLETPDPDESGKSEVRECKTGINEATHASLLRQDFGNVRATSSISEPKPQLSFTDTIEPAMSLEYGDLQNPKAMDNKSKPTLQFNQNALRSPMITTSAKEGTKNGPTHVIDEQASAHHVTQNKPLSSDVTVRKGTNPFGQPLAEAKTQPVSTRTAADPGKDITSRFDDLTNRFKKEFGLDVYEKILTENRSKRSKANNLNTPGTPSASLTNPRIIFSSEEASSVNALQENENPKGHPTSPQLLSVQPKTASLPQKSTLRSQANMNAVGNSTDQSPQSGKQDTTNTKSVSSGNPPKSASPKTASESLTRRDENTTPQQNGNGASAPALDTKRIIEEKPDFKTVYQQKLPCHPLDLCKHGKFTEGQEPGGSPLSSARRGLYGRERRGV